MRPSVPIGEHLIVRLWERVQAKSERIAGGCLEWRGQRFPQGYGKIKVRDPLRKKQRTFYVHRVAYVALNGEPDSHLTVDHLCRNRACVEGTHLEAVTTRVNILRGIGPTAINARKAVCDSGHEFTDENTHLYRTGSGWGRRCRTCEHNREIGVRSERRLALRIEKATDLLRENGYHVSALESR